MKKSNTTEEDLDPLTNSGVYVQARTSTFVDLTELRKASRCSSVSSVSSISDSH